MSEERAILHSDLNSFYASVEMMLDPSLKGKAVAVCGSTENRHGIVLAKSELAKRAGVKTGMVNWEARQLCKDLIMVPPQYDQYLKYSKLTRAIYERYTDQVEPFGMDECWLDVTGSWVQGSPMEIAEQIRKSTKEELGLTVSIGVSFNKIFAKLGSDMKKPDAITEITKAEFKEKVWPLHCSEMIYCGPATTKKLAMFGINTIGDVANTDPAFLKQILGVYGLSLWTFASGNDNSRVMQKDFVSPVKSVGHGITCTADLENEDEVFRVILELSQDVGHRLRIHGLSARGVQIYVRGNDLFGSQFQCKLPLKTQLPGEIALAGFRLFHDKYHWNKNVRAVCIRAIEGNVVHYGYIERFIERLGERFNIREIAFDRWGAVQMVQNLEGMGFTVVPFGQGFKDMSPPTKELMKLVLEQRIAHAGHPVLRWMMDNIYVRTDPAGNIKPDKEKSTEKIDGAVATIMALDRAIRCGNDTGESVYDSRGLLFI